MTVGNLLWAASPSAYSAYSRMRGRVIDRVIERNLSRAIGDANTVSSDSAPAPALEARLANRLERRSLVERGDGPPHVLYVSRPSIWERHNVPSEIAKVARVSTYFFADRGFMDEGHEWLQHRDSMNTDLLAFVRELHAKDPINVLVGYLSGWNVSPATIEAIAAMGIVTCNYCLDDKLSFFGRRIGDRWSGPAAIAKAFDLNLTSSPASIRQYEALGALAMFWPEGANPDHFRPLDRPFRYDVSFVGAWYGYRPILVQRLKQAKINVATFGPGWPSGEIGEDEMVDVYAASRINLGFGGIGYSTRSQCLKGRDFEVPMCGAVYLTSDNPELDLVWTREREIATYRDAEDCIEKVRGLLANPDACCAIRIAARERGLREHTWAERFRTLLRVVGMEGQAPSRCADAPEASHAGST